MVSWCKKGEHNAQMSPKIGAMWVQVANSHNKYFHDPMSLAHNAKLTHATNSILPPSFSYPPPLPPLVKTTPLSKPRRA